MTLRTLSDVMQTERTSFMANSSISSGLLLILANASLHWSCVSLQEETRVSENSHFSGKNVHRPHECVKFLL